MAEWAVRALGKRIHVNGLSCSGKSTLGAELSALLDVPCVELDALNWLPGWVGLNATDPERFSGRIRAATSGDGWVVAGSYARFARDTFWPRLHTMIFLDLPRGVLLVRVLRRSWQRWRKRELLWGTNYETFWPQLAIWKKEDSLVWWIWTQQARKRDEMASFRADPATRHVRFVHLRSLREIEEFRRLLGLPPAPLR